MLHNMIRRLFNLIGTLRGAMIWIADSTDTFPIAVNGNVTVYSKMYNIYTADNLGVSLKLAGSSPQITITAEEGAIAPATANINAADSNYTVPVGVAPICTNLTSTTVQIQPLSLVPMKHVRFKIVGGASNGSDTTVSLGMFLQELVA